MNCAGFSGWVRGRGDRLREESRAGSRPSAFRYVAVATYSSGKIKTGKSASGLPALAFPGGCAGEVTGCGRRAAQAQGLRPFAMWLSPHIHPKKVNAGNPQAAFRRRFFRMTARLVEKIKNPLTTGRRSDNVCSEGVSTLVG